MGSNDHIEVPDPKPLNWWVAFKRWLARVLGVKSGLTITIPPGATLIMPPDSVVETMVVSGGNVNYAVADLRNDAIVKCEPITTVESDQSDGLIPKAAGENGQAPTHRRPDPPPAPPEKRYG